MNHSVTFPSLRAYNFFPFLLLVRPFCGAALADAQFMHHLSRDKMRTLSFPGRKTYQRLPPSPHLHIDLTSDGHDYIFRLAWTEKCNKDVNSCNTYTHKLYMISKGAKLSVLSIRPLQCAAKRRYGGTRHGYPLHSFI